GIRGYKVTGVQTCALPIFRDAPRPRKKYERVFRGRGSSRNVGRGMSEAAQPEHAFLPRHALRRGDPLVRQAPVIEADDAAAALRSEERRVGKECRSRGESE